MSLGEFLESKWFVRLFRASVLVGTFMISGGGLVVTWAVLDTKAQAEKAIVGLTEVRQTQTDRARDQEKFQLSTSGDLNALRVAINTQGLDIATIKGILTKKDDVASRFTR